MLEINTVTNAIYLTKGDSGIINITLTGDSLGDYNDMKFYVRNAQNQDSVMFTLGMNDGDTEKGIITGSGNSYSIRIYPAATLDMKRKKYVYDIKLISGNETTTGDVITFVGGGTVKTEFWVT